MSDQPADPARSPIGWPRAILTATIIVAVGIAGVAYLPHYLVTNVTSLSGTPLQGLAATVCFGTVIVLAVVLRRLQQRGVL